MRLSTIAVIALIAATVVYAGFRSQTLFRGPPVTIISPAAHTMVPQVVTIVGFTEQATYLTVNDRQIYPDPNGHFEHTLVLPVGYTVVEVFARNRHAREKVIHLPLDVYDSIQEEIR